MMTLSKEDAELFYELWFPLLDFVNEKLDIEPDMGKIQGAEHTGPAKVKKIANALWGDTKLIDKYLRNYGEKISEENQVIIKSWKRKIEGKFILERNLKAGSIFISANTNKVYLVKGIISSWEEMFFYRSPPIMLEAVLIPFKDTIITDGLVMPYNISFGGGYSGEFREIYMEAKKGGRINKLI